MKFIMSRLLKAVQNRRCPKHLLLFLFSVGLVVATLWVSSMLVTTKAGLQAVWFGLPLSFVAFDLSAVSGSLSFFPRSFLLDLHQPMVEFSVAGFALSIALCWAGIEMLVWILEKLFKKR